MDIISTLLAPLQWPAGGVWETIIQWFSGVGNFGLAIILITICLKLILLPIEFWQRSVTRKMSVQQALLQPELKKIEEKYGKSEAGQQKTAELYKKHGVSPTSSCGVMLLYFGLTMMIFITLFGALGNISQHQINYEYYQLKNEYVTVYNQNKNATDFDTNLYQNATEFAVATSQNAVAEKYEQIREGFLSIKNIWRPDNWSSVFPNVDEFISTTGTKFYVVQDAQNPYNNYVLLSTDTVPFVDINGNVYAVHSAEPQNDPATLEIEGETYNIIYADTSLVTEQKDINAVATDAALSQFKTEFDTVTKGINDKYAGQWNGYLVLILLAGVVTFFSQYLSTIGTKVKDKKGNQVDINNVKDKDGKKVQAQGAKSKMFTGILLAGMMVAFTFGYTSMFAIYIVTNSILSIAGNILINLINNKIDNKKDKIKTKSVTADYVRID